MVNYNQSNIQAKLFDFALKELVIAHRDSFKPIWSIESWAKFMIWLALNCGVNGQKESLNKFGESLGAPLTSSMRRVFFERSLETYSLKIIADPSESDVFIFSISQSEKLLLERVSDALEELELNSKVILERSSWNIQEGMIIIPWK